MLRYLHTHTTCLLIHSDSNGGFSCPGKSMNIRDYFALLSIYNARNYITRVILTVPCDNNGKEVISWGSGIFIGFSNYLIIKKIRLEVFKIMLQKVY